MRNDINGKPPIYNVGRSQVVCISCRHLRCPIGVDKHPTVNQVLLICLPSVGNDVCRDPPAQQVVCFYLSGFESNERLKGEGFKGGLGYEELRTDMGMRRAECEAAGSGTPSASCIAQTQD